LEKPRRRTLIALTAVAGVTFYASFALTTARLEAQNRKNFSIVNEDNGHIALGLAIRKLNVAGTFMQCPAHPDDETNGLFTTFGYGMGLRVIDLQDNRGDGGQNEIGPELFRDIGVLRTAELLAAHQIDGAEQYFTRAIDYGYSFSPEEVIAKWGREEIVGDYVRLFRTLRPDIIVTMNIQGGGGDRAHEAQTILVREAYGLAGDPTKYPEQLREGLRPWKPYKLYFSGTQVNGRRPPGDAGRGGPGGGGSAAAAGGPWHVDRVDMNAYDALLGRTYQEIATDAHSNHKCQGTGGLPPIAGIAGGRGGGGGRGGPGGGAGGPQAVGSPYALVDTTMPEAKDKPEGALFDGINITMAGLAKYAGANPPAALTSGLEAIASAARQATAAFDGGNDAATAAPIEAGLTALRALRANLASMGLSDDAKYEIDFRLKHKELDYEDAVIAAHGIVFNAIANDGLIVAGQPIGLSFSAVNRGATDISVSDVTILGFDAASPCQPATVHKDGAFSCSSNATVPKTARLTDPYFTDTYWKNPSGPARYTFDPGVPFGVPFAPTPFHAIFKVKAGSVEVMRDQRVEYRYVRDLYFGDKRMELNVVPAFSVQVTPTLAIVPAAATPAAKPVDREVFVSVTNGTKGAAQATVALGVPAGWKVAPASAPLSFEKEDESLSARFVVTAPVGAKLGEYAFKATITSPATGSEAFSSGYQEIEYPHIERRQVIKPAETDVKVINVKMAPGVKVGYIMGVGDLVPPAIEQLGAKVTFIETNELAWGDLSKYDVIITGVRAYERRDDLRAYNRRLLDYVNAGGTVIVNYNKNEFNQAQYGPYPAQIGGLGVSGRVNDETVPVKILDPEDPVFNFPNKLGTSVWDNWTQERGQYFLGKKDPKYIDLVSMTDSFPDNPGEQLGGLVEAKYGKGRWLYLGLGLWRQLPSGTIGAYQLLANLLSLPKAPDVAHK
jgi:LmbE family N-acetylglucosaminyl deacetylase